jgi:hypothetical protein
MRLNAILLSLCLGLSACGGGGGASGTGAPTIKAADYTLPAAVPSVPDQAANQ